MVSLISGLNQQKVEPNMGIISKNLYFKSDTEQMKSNIGWKPLHVKIDHRRFGNNKLFEHFITSGIAQ